MSSSSEKRQRQDFETYLGPRSDYFLKRFAHLQAGGGMWSWNWSAFWLGGLWAFYRKLWIPGAAVLLAQVVLVEILPTAAKPLAWLVDLPFAAVANWLYLQQVERHVAGARAAGGDDGDVRVRLIVRGGTTYVPFLLAAAIWLVLMFRNLPLDF